jgi:hypothetical protein
MNAKPILRFVGLLVLVAWGLHIAWALLQPVLVPLGILVLGFVALNWWIQRR